MPLIVFEGIDGAGKSTLMRRLEQEAKKKGQTTYMTREPGGTDLGERIRQMLLTKEHEAPTAMTELLLYEAGRRQHVDLVIKPRLAKNEMILCDRFTDSSLAFQCGGRGVDRKLVDQLNNIATDSLKPDLVVLVDVSVEEGEKRMAGRELDRFESEKSDFHKRVQDYYRMLSKEKGADHWLVLDGTKTPEELFQIVWLHFMKKGWV